MGVIGWFLKSKKEMAKPNTKHVRIGKYEVTSHAQNRTVSKSHDLKKSDMVKNLLGKSQNSKPYKYRDGTMQYDRVNDKNRTITFITLKNVVKTIHKYHNNKRGYKAAHKNLR